MFNKKIPNLVIARRTRRAPDCALQTRPAADEAISPTRSLHSLILLLAACLATLHAHAVDLRIASFSVDATPPLGSPLCGAAVPPANGVDDPLFARGLILLPEGQSPVVLVSVDWVGIGNEGNTAWRAALADAAHTTIDRVAVQTIHQHDTPLCDFSVEALLAKAGLSGAMFDPAFARDVIRRAAEAAHASLAHAVPVTHLGLGKAKVDRVASNRRVMGPDGKVAAVRWSATKEAEVRAAPEGTIDPWMRAVSLWNGDTPIVVLTYYATHPQSHYGKGQVSADFPGLARARRDADLPGVRFIHFDGAGGNVTAGKYNDGAPENRPVLVGRMYDGMKAAFDNTERVALKDLAFDWKVEPVELPLRPEIDLAAEKKTLADPNADPRNRHDAASEIAWTERCLAKTPIELSRLRLGPAQLLHMPGELFIEYQLAAQSMAPNDFVCTAAYGDYGPGYIGTAASYPEGGYETQLHTSRTAPEVEGLLIGTLESLLK